MAPYPRTAIEVGPYRIELATHSAYVGGRRIAMRPRTVELAALLFARRGTLVSRQELYEFAWGPANSVTSRTLDVHISWIRKALALDGTHGWRLSAVRGKGYRLEAGSPRRRLLRPP